MNWLAAARRRPGLLHRRPARRLPLNLEALEERTVLSLAIGAMGDSMTAAYPAPYQNWVQLLQNYRGGSITVDDFGVGGATSGSLLSGGQATAVANLVKAGKVNAAYLMIGANDVPEYISTIAQGNFTPFVTEVVANIETAVKTVLAAGSVKMVMANIPDISTTPAYQSAYAGDPAVLADITAATEQANTQIQAFAASKSIPVVDMFDISYIPQQNNSIDGSPIPVGDYYLPDGFHPSTLGQGLIANTILQGFHDGYNTNIVPLRLSDQQAFTADGLTAPPGGATYFDTSPYVIYPPLANFHPLAAAMGDDLTASYSGQPWGSNGDLSWADLFGVLKPNSGALYNEAVPDASSATLLSGGQATTVANLAKAGAVNYSILEVGVVDVLNDISTISQGNFTPFVNSVVANVEQALQTVINAGYMRQAVADIPDPGVSPAFQSSVGDNPAVLADVTKAVQLANQKIVAFAENKGIPVIDLYGLSHLIENPITIGGVQTSDFFTSDGLHPSTVVEGLIANTVLQAFYVGYGINVQSLRLTDQQILTEAGVSYPSGPTTYFDVTPYVIVRPPAGPVQTTIIAQGTPPTSGPAANPVAGADTAASVALNQNAVVVPTPSAGGTAAATPAVTTASLVPIVAAQPTAAASQTSADFTAAGSPSTDAADAVFSQDGLNLTTPPVL